MAEQIQPSSFYYAPTWLQIVKSYTDFSAASLTNDIEILSLPEGCAIHGVTIKHNEQFDGGLISSYTLSVGITGNLSKYASAFNVNTPVSDTNFQLTQDFFIEDWGAITSIRAEAISIGDLLNSATSGEVEFYILLSQVKIIT